MNNTKQPEKQSKNEHRLTPPSVSLPKGGGAIRGIGEKFAANPVTGSGSLSVPIYTSPGRSGFGPELSLSYDSGAGNGIFGFGWCLALPAITRKTEKGLPIYFDAEESDVFILSGAEDLIPVLVLENGQWKEENIEPRIVNGIQYHIRRYRPRIEGLFARIERWSNQTDPTDIFWRSISKDNIMTWYGKTETSRIFDPADATHIFSWLISESYDDKGNVIVYSYEKENSDNISQTLVHEHNRTAKTRSSNRILKRIYYGNHQPYLPELSADKPWPIPPEKDQWFFEVVFDYGEHDLKKPLPEESNKKWPCRPDPFSSYKAGFEIRTYRLCQRVLMFHHFPKEKEGQNCLVRSTDFTYSLEESPALSNYPNFSFLLAVTQTGYQRGSENDYLTKSLPPLEFEYTLPQIDETVREVNLESVMNLPQGLDGQEYQWVDLDGEGLSGVLTEQAGGWFYKRNLSPITIRNEAKEPLTEVRLGPLELVGVKPSLANLDNGRQQLLDLAGDGRLDLVQFGGSVPGFYERTTEGSWEAFTSFASIPVLDWNNPNLKFVDLTGDGHADILISEDQVFWWYPSRAEAGFGPPRQAHQAFDEEKGPKLIFADGTHSIFMADMSGDGLTDLVRISNGEVAYWANLGYGRFGTKITMDNSPYFDSPERFSPSRIRLVDIDGSGATDLIYLGVNGPSLYFNQSGNSWSEGKRLSRFPMVDNYVSIQITDLLGNGTACLVWSSPLPGDSIRPMRYVDLMGGRKPYLLTKLANNLGAETEIDYAPSTKFYLADQQAGKPWITKIPFPVHVVERVIIYDRISGNRFVTKYAYHHGYFDGDEREFRGFGRVDQWDTEEFAALNGGERPLGNNVGASSHLPPVLTRTWFHTGVFQGREHISNYFAGFINDQDQGEYYRESGWSEEEVRKHLLDDTVLPSWLTATEEREACRALKGSMLRQEIYALDGTDRASNPYLVTEQNFRIQLVQPQLWNRHAVFFSHSLETLSYHYERNPHDPRIGHELSLEVDGFGNVRKTASISYGRLKSDLDSEKDRNQQKETLVIYTEHDFTNPVEEKDAYRTPLSCESRTYQLTGFTPTAAGRFRDTDLVKLTENGLAALGKEIGYHETPSSGEERRLIEQVRTLYRPNNLSGPLALKKLESMALSFESYKLAFTPGLMTEVYQGRVTETMLADEGRYIYSEADTNWWIPTGQVFYSPDPNDAPAQELTYARGHFFLPRRFRDPFHTNAASMETVIRYDGYDLLVQESIDALGNRVTAGERHQDPMQPLIDHGLDYRTLQPVLVMDPNRNRTAVAFDALGMVVGTAVMSKPEDHPQLGDDLAGFIPNLPENIISSHLQNPMADPHGILLQATTRLAYDLFAYMRTKTLTQPDPAVVYTLARETHNSQTTKIQHSFTYSDGFGREIQKKIQAEPGPVPKRDPVTGKIIIHNGQPELTSTDVSPRWVGSGWTVYNNKGKAVRKYEPFFTDTHRFEFEILIGISPVLFYDPVGRVVATLHPNHTWEKVVFNPWRQMTWDMNDTLHPQTQFDPRIPNVLPDHAFNPANDADVGGYFQRLDSSEYLPTWLDLRLDTAKAVAKWPDPVVREVEQDAAQKAVRHAATPTVVHFDSMGHSFLSVVDNGLDDQGKPQLFNTHAYYDIEGNQRQISDALGRLVMSYDFDLLGNRIHQASMEAGERWTFNDVAGKPLYAWDNRDHRFRTSYDQLRRPTGTFLREGNGPEIRLGKTVYGETQSQSAPETHNLRGKVFQVFDQAGVVTTDDYDFKGNLLSSRRQLAGEYKAMLDWSGSVSLESSIYYSATVYDALNRTLQITAPDASVIRLTYNEANLLNQVATNLRGATIATDFIKNIDYNAKGQRTRIDYGNGVRTNYEYDPLTFRLVHLLTIRETGSFPGDCPQPSPDSWPGCQVQNLHYTYDPNGNITRIGDAAQQAVYFRNKRVEPEARYTYDALYRLVGATGREHLGQTNGRPNPPTPPHPMNSFHTRLDHPGDGQAMGTYFESYLYDAVGNILSIQHRGSDPVHQGWTRTYEYNETSQLERSLKNNRLSSTTVGTVTEKYYYDGSAGLHGNITAMPHLPLMQWDHHDQLRATSRQVAGNGMIPETTWYVYDSAGQRVRKVTDGQTNTGETPRRRKERIYLGGFEIYREYENDGQTVKLERQTLHLMDNKQRIALVESRTQGRDPAPEKLIRYQLGNHLGSASLELDEKAQIISYEEYYPYGSTSYQAVRNQTETPKRYRYTGKERDDENGLYYHGARYYASLLGRWTSCDPLEINDGVNVYTYVKNKPLLLIDKNGKNGTRAKDIISEKTEPAGNRTFYHVIDWREQSPETPGYSAVGNQMAEIQSKGIIPSKTPASGQFGVGVYAFPEEKQAQSLAGANRPYAAFQVDPTTPVRQITVRLKEGKTDTYVIIAPGSSTNVRTTDLEFKNASPQQMATYQEAIAINNPSTIKNPGSGLKPNGSSFLSKAGGYLRAAGSAVKQTVKSMIPGSEIYDYIKYTAGGGSFIAGAKLMTRSAVTSIAQGAKSFVTAGSLELGGVVGIGVIELYELNKATEFAAEKEVELNTNFEYAITHPEAWGGF